MVTSFVDRSALQNMANQTANQYGIPTGIFSSLIQTESSWNPTAQAQGSTAFGLTQLVRGTANEVGVTNINDPQQQLSGGASYLKKQYDKFGNWRDALSAYNQGPGAYSNDAGRAYADRVLAGAKEGGAPGASPGGVGMFPDYSQMGTLNDSMLRPGEATAQGADLRDDPMGWLQAQIGNVGLVVLGVVVIGVGLVAATNSGRKFVIESAKAATNL